MSKRKKKATRVTCPECKRTWPSAAAMPAGHECEPKKEATRVVCKKHTGPEQARLLAVRAVINRELRYLVRVVGTFTDDHILGCVVTVGGHGLRTATLALPWCGWEGVAAAKYANESDAAYNEFVEVVAGQIEAQDSDEDLLSAFEPVSGWVEEAS